MPSGNLTDANVGIAVPLSYGYNRVAGNNLAYIQLPPAPSGVTDATATMQIGFYDGGEGEWGGPDALFINGNRMFAFDTNGRYIAPNPAEGTIPVGGGSADTSPIVGTLYSFSFHSGVDAQLNGGDNAKQYLDPLWDYFNGLVTPLRYSRRAYWGIGWIPQINGSQSQMQPVCDMRCMICRIFDADGNQTGYQFTTNPIWHLVDVWLRRAIKPQYTIDFEYGAQALTSNEQGCFRWDIISESAAYCDEVISTGAPRFQGSYAFASGTTLAAMQEQMLLVCRGYQQEIAGKLAFFVDKPRSSVFIVSADMLIPNTFQADDTLIHQNANRYIATFLETGLPAVSLISTIARSEGVVTIETIQPNPCAAGDLIVVGGVVDDSFDQAYQVTSVTSGVISANTSATDAAASTGGALGYLESRFAQRTPEAPAHIQHQMAQGQVLPPNAGGQRLKRIKVNYNYANCSWDQALRILLYERYRDLGPDASPYKPPVRITLQLWSESIDVNGEVLWDYGPGSVISLDSTVFYEYAGDYEIMEQMPHPFQVEPQQQGGTSITEPAANSGTIELVLWSFQEAAFTDDSGVANASFATVPGTFLYDGGAVGSFEMIGGSLVISATPETGTGSDDYICFVSWTGLTLSVPGGDVVHIPDGSTTYNSTSGPATFYIGELGEISLITSGETAPTDAVFFQLIETPGDGSITSYYY